MSLVIKSNFETEGVFSTSMNAGTPCKFTHFAHRGMVLDSVCGG